MLYVVQAILRAGCKTTLLCTGEIPEIHAEPGDVLVIDALDRITIVRPTEHSRQALLFRSTSLQDLASPEARDPLGALLLKGFRAHLLCVGEIPEISAAKGDVLALDELDRITIVRVTGLTRQSLLFRSEILRVLDAPAPLELPRRGSRWTPRWSASAEASPSRVPPGSN